MVRAGVISVQIFNCAQEADSGASRYSAKMVVMNATSQAARPIGHLLTPPAVIDEEMAWRRIVTRDAAPAFFYAVITTGVFCLPGCKSKRPLRKNVRFFLTADEARYAGFRPCKRCRPDAPAGVGVLEKIRGYIEVNVERAVPLAELGRIAGLSPFTVQRLFKQAMGVSPLQYQRALRAGRLRNGLKQGSNVTDAIYEAGFGSSSRAYEGSALGMTPGRFARGGLGERIGFTTTRSAFGWLVVGATERGLCWLALGGTAAEAEATLRAEFPHAILHRDPSLAELVQAAVDAVAGKAKSTQELSLDLRGTAFQLRAWNALKAIPRGETRSYCELARELGNPKATRAVARACATNRVALVVPCHRVVGASGSLTGYRWGVERKRKLLEAEKTR
jgi:AraC family transcriptional regulator of adaptative response/methylated-DNA-[protein]-cysteine methyltransferase